MEPARKLPEDEYNEFQPHLRAIPGGGETTDDRPARGNLRIADDDLASLEKDATKSNDLDSRDIRDAENDRLRNGFYRPSPDGKQERITFKSFFKKKGPLAAILSLLVGGGGAFSIMFAPGLGIVQLKEALLGDLNDQVAALDIRSDHLLKSKLKGLQAGASICSNAVKIRCKFNTMTDRQIQRYRNAGFEIETEKTALGRHRITGMRLPISEGLASVVIKDPQDLVNARKLPEVRRAMNRVFNPVYAGLSDSVSKQVFKAKQTSKAKKLQGVTTEALDDSYQKSIKGQELNQRGTGIIVEEGKKPYIIDGDGTRVEEGSPRFTELAEANGRIGASVADSLSSGVKATSGVIGSGIKGVSVLGAADTACTVFNTARAVSAAAKATRSIQLIQFAMIFLVTADAIKAGDATPEEVAYLGNILTATDTNKEVKDETTLTGTNKNPFYGKSAFDAPGIKVASHNDAPVLTSRSQQYMIGGGLTGTLSGVIGTIESALAVNGTSGIKSTCGVVQSWWARGAGLIAGVAIGIGSFGASTAISVGVSLAIGFALPFLEAMLADIIAGNVVDKTTKGVDAGDALFAGSAALLGAMAQMRGLLPMNMFQFMNYSKATNQVKSEIALAETLEAKETPFDIMNQYSFLGRLARSLNIPYIQSSSPVQQFASILSIVPSSIFSLTSDANAMTEINPERFKRCNDIGYEDLGLEADVFCNLRFGLTPEILALSTEAVLDYMIDNSFINIITGEPKGDYKEFVKHCVERQDGWGESSDAEDNSEEGSGKACLKTTFKSGNTNYFRAYTIDKSINDAMDGDTEVTGGSGSVGEIALPVSEGFQITSQFGPRKSPIKTKNLTWHKGIDFVTSDRAVYAMAEGEVVSIGGTNNTVTIRHNDGLRTMYLHMPNNTLLVKVGDTVTAGQRIGTMGAIGEATGVHLHFDINIAEVDEASKEAYSGYTKNAGGTTPGFFISPAEFFSQNGINGF